MVVPIVERILRRFLYMHDMYYSNLGWAAHWKIVSRFGHDMHNNVPVDYGNLEYTLLYKLLSWDSLTCFELMGYLTELYPTLDPDEEVETDHSLSMKGDMMETIMAALEGRTDFTPAIDQSNVVPAELFAEFCRLCGAPGL